MTVNHVAVGSSPTKRANSCTLSSAVEHFLDMEKVTGSNPVGCTIHIRLTSYLICSIIVYAQRDRHCMKEHEPHYHEDKKTGLLVRCMNSCSNLITDYRFWIGVTISYPLEHFLWEHVWPFKLVMQFLGL